MSSVILITGASRGIGADVARLLGARGARVALVARDRAQLERVADAVTAAGGEAFVHPADFTTPGAARAAVEATVARFGRLDVLVNNAGYGMKGVTEQLPPEEVTRLFQVNLFAAIEATQAALPVMRTQQAGQIINITSMAAHFALPFHGVYSASKAALTLFSQSLRPEVAPFGITVTVVLPSVTATPFFDATRTFFRTPRTAAPSFPIPVQSSLTVARAIVRAIDRPRRAVYPFPGSRVALLLTALFPGLVDAALARQGEVQAVLRDEGYLPSSHDSG